MPLTFICKVHSAKVNFSFDRIKQFSDRINMGLVYNFYSIKLQSLETSNIEFVALKIQPINSTITKIILCK